MSRARLKSVDFYRKIPKDMTEGTIPGSVISVLASLVIAMLLVSEISTRLTPQFNTRVVVDRSLDGDLMRINFNVSFPALSCEFASVDVGDAMGLNRYNLTKTVFKRPIDADLNPLGPIQWERGEKQKPVEHADELQHDKAQALVKYHTEERARDPTGSDEHPPQVLELSAKTFETAKKQNTVLLVNFYAPWCPWSRRLDPVWKAAALETHKKYPETLANKVRVAEVDCTKHEALCVAQHVQGYPSVRVYTKGSDAMRGGGKHDHASYHGDRTVEAIVKFATDLLTGVEDRRGGGEGFTRAKKWRCGFRATRTDTRRCGAIDRPGVFGDRVRAGEESPRPPVDHRLVGHALVPPGIHEHVARRAPLLLRAAALAQPQGSTWRSSTRASTKRVARAPPRRAPATGTTGRSRRRRGGLRGLVGSHRGLAR